MAILELLETPELSALAPLKLYLRSSNAVYALEGQVRLPQQMQTLLAQVQAKCQQGGHQLYTVRSLQSWVSLEAWLVAEYGGETWAVLVTGQVVTRPIGQAEPKVFSDREDRRIASGGTAAWLPVNPTLGSK